MSFAAGVFSLAAGNPVVSGSTIQSSWANSTLTDIATGLSTCVLKDGTQTITANLPMSGFRHTGVGNATTRAAATYASAADVQDNTLKYLTAVSGTNTVLATAAASMTAYAVGQTFQLIPASTNTGATTLNINNIGAKNVFTSGVALTGGEFKIGVPVTVIYDGTQFQVTGSALLLIDTLGQNWNNRLINGDWLIDQINEGALYTVNTTDVRGPDGWSGSAVGAGVFKLRQLADPDNAALKCMEITCTTADAAIGATDDYFIYAAIEGYNIADLQLGISTASSVTIRFKFRSNVTGVYGISLANSAKNRSNYQIITVPDTSEHEYTLTFALDTTGTWLYTSGVGLYLAICLSAGTNFQGTAGAWAADAKQTTAAQCNFMSVNTNIAYLKRISLTPGLIAVAYGPQDVQKALAWAQRQYAKSFPQGTAVAQNVGANTGESTVQAIAAGTNSIRSYVSYPVIQRTAGSVTFYNPAATNAQARDETAAADCSSTTASDVTDKGFEMSTTGNAGTTSTGRIGFHWTSNARLS